MQKLADLGKFAQRSQQLHHAHQCAAHAQVNSHENLHSLTVLIKKVPATFLGVRSGIHPSLQI